MHRQRSVSWRQHAYAPTDILEKRTEIGIAVTMAFSCVRDQSGPSSGNRMHFVPSSTLSPGVQSLHRDLFTSSLRWGTRYSCVDAPPVCLRASSYVILRIKAVSNIPSQKYLKESNHAHFYTMIRQSATMMRIMSQKYLAEGILR